MKRQTLKKLKLGLGLVIGTGLMSACTKTVPYDTVYKEKVHEKAEIDTQAEYLYVASSDIASRDDMGSAGARPYMQGAEFITKFKFTEETLRIVQVNDEERLQSNSLNEKVLLEIPIKHVEYRCQEDRYGKCTNKEEENSEKNWSQKRNFIPDFSKIKSPGLSLLPVESDKLWGENCYKETSSRFMDYQLEKDALNFQVEKTFTGSFECLRGLNGFNGMTDLQVQIVFHYSFVKMSNLTSKNYKTVHYPRRDDSNLFGFFSTEYRKYDVDYVRRESNRQDFMNRWNPERKEIKYYLTDNFKKPEFKPLVDATKVAFERINKGLKTAGAQFQLSLHDGEGRAPGDIRNSMIILVEDPIAAGPLGYGPSVANPRTGEIVSARTVMYWGNLLQGVSMTYDDLVREMKRKGRTQLSPRASGPATQAPQNQRNRLELSQELARRLSMQNAYTAQISKGLAQKTTADYMRAKGSSVNQLQRGDTFTRENMRPNDLSRLTEKEFMRLTMQVDHTSDPEDRIAQMSKGHCMYPSELFPFDEAIAAALDKRLSGDLKLWEDLSDSEKQDIIALVAPEIWIPTLVHEIGHNLGLRHNFGGSEDKDNFYTEAELAAMGVKHKIPYSSVMDYGARELNTLPTLGKYDIAALRFGYARKIELADGSLAKVETTVKDLKAKNSELKIKDYQYCTDEHVSVNPNCQRFDEGTNRVEILQSKIDQYHRMHSLRTTRRGRENFSEMNDRSALMSARFRFSSIRAFMESYESIKYRFGIADDDDVWKDVEWLKDVRDAAILSGRFLVDVLKTPDLHCAVARKEKPNEIFAIDRLDAFNPSGIDCFEDANLNSNFVVVGQGGKTFKNRKSPRSDNTYADQIDARGTWIDKVAAAQMLFSRRTGNSIFDRNQDNYLDLPGVSEEVTKALTDMILDTVSSPIEFVDKDGKVLVATQNFRHTVFSTPDDLRGSKASHWMSVPLDSGLARYLGVEQQKSFQELLLNIVNKSMTGSQSHWREGREFMDKLRVIKTSRAYQLNGQEQVMVKDIGGMRFAALGDNLLAQQVMSMATIGEVLSELTAEQIDELLAERKAAPGNLQAAPGQAAIPGQAGAVAPTPAPAAPAVSKYERFKTIPTNVIEAYKAGAMGDHRLLTYLLTILPMSNDPSVQ